MQYITCDVMVMRCLITKCGGTIIDWIENGGNKEKSRTTNETVGYGGEMWAEVDWTCRKTGGGENGKTDI